MQLWRFKFPHKRKAHNGHVGVTLKGELCCWGVKHQKVQRLLNFHAEVSESAWENKWWVGLVTLVYSRILMLENTVGVGRVNEDRKWCLLIIYLIFFSQNWINWTGTRLQEDSDLDAPTSDAKISDASNMTEVSIGINCGRQHAHKSTTA